MWELSLKQKWTSTKKQYKSHGSSLCILLLQSCLTNKHWRCAYPPLVGDIWWKQFLYRISCHSISADESWIRNNCWGFFYHHIIIIFPCGLVGGASTLLTSGTGKYPHLHVQPVYVISAPVNWILLIRWIEFSACLDTCCSICMAFIDSPMRKWAHHNTVHLLQ